MDGKRRQAPFEKYADCRFRAHPALDGLRAVGLGYGGQRASTGLPEEVWFRDRAKRSYSPDDAESRGQRHLSHRDVHGISATATRQGGFSRTDESTRGAA